MLLQVIRKLWSDDINKSGKEWQLFFPWLSFRNINNIKSKEMKKTITLLFIFLLLGITAKSANTYLIYSSTTGGTWTNTAGIINPVPVDLSTVNVGSSASLNAWFTDRSSVAPTMGGGSQFAAGDQVWIIKGTYLLTDTVKLYDGVSLYGGFSGAESSISARVKGTNAWDFTNETILDGNATTVGIAGGSATLATVVDGLTIGNCKNSTSNTSGAGARLNGAQTTMQNCIIRNCITAGVAPTSSGGVVLTGGSTIKDCYIHDNQTNGYGGGVTVTGDGCALSRCKIANNSSSLFGGGVNLYSTTSGVSVSNCDISNNTTTTKSAGGLLVFSTSVTNANPIAISNCTFTSNSAPITTSGGSGGALYLNTKVGNVVNVSNCTFTSNTASVAKSTTAGGGAIWVGTGTHNIDGCTFTNNSVSASHGGAILIGSATATAKISNSVFAGNMTTQYGSALMLTYSTTVNNCLIYGNKGSNAVYVGSTAGVVGTFNNCTFASNTSNATPALPVCIYMSSPGTGAFTNCLFYNSGTNPLSGGATPTITYCGFENTVTQAYATANNCINTIGSTSFVDVANNDYHLVTGSTAINAGTAIAACTRDLSGVVRPQGAVYDMGAYEFVDTPTSVNKVENSFDCYAYGSNVIIKGAAYGNEVNVYSVTGIRVFSQRINTGSLSITLPTGIYIVNVATCNKKIVVR